MAVQISGAQVKPATLAASNVNFTDSSQWHFGSNQSLQWAGTPSAGNDIVNKTYVDGISAGLHWKDSVRVRSTANMTLSNPGVAAIDGVTLSNGDRILVAAQSTGSENGIYVWAGSGSAMTRSTDMDAGSEFPGAACFVREGSSYADTGWVCTNDAVTLGSTAINFTQFTGAAQIIAGNGLAKSGNTLSAVVDGATLAVSASGLKVADGQITNLQVSNSAAIAYSKLSLGASITNADLAGSIADSKLLQITTAAKVAGSAVELKSGGPLVNSSGLTINSNGVTNAMLQGSIANSKLANRGITVTDGSTAQAVDLGQTLTFSSGSGMTVTQSGGTVTIAGANASTSAKGVAQFSASHFSVSSGTVSAQNMTVTAGNALTGGGAVTLGGTVSLDVAVDNASIEIASDALRLKNNGTGLAKLAFQPYQEAISASSNQTTIDLARPLSANWDKYVQVFKNGLQLRNETALGGSATDNDEYTVSLTGGGGGNARITMGAGLTAGDAVVIAYIA
tara:strand:- start:2252 stop:3775 length:1524 start_codon:yes stop_codon:yes gene_type:complete